MTRTVVIVLLLLSLGVSTACGKNQQIQQGEHIDQQTKRGSAQPSATTAETASAASPTQPAPPVAQSQPQAHPFSYRGVHAGMTMAEVKAATERHRGLRAIGSDDRVANLMQCVDNYGGPSHDTPAIECAFETDSGGVKLFFFRKHLFYIRWRCTDNDECVKEKALMNSHFGTSKSNRMEAHPAQVGAFQEQTVRWRSRQESASVGGGQFEVLNYDFAPSFVQRQ